jgi:hypothetical protein
MIKKLFFAFLLWQILSGAALSQGSTIEWISPEQQKSINPPRPHWVGYDFSWISSECKKPLTKPDLSIYDSFSYVDQHIKSGKSPTYVRILFDKKLKENPISIYNRVGWAYSSCLESYSPNLDRHKKDEIFAKAEWLIRNLPKESIIQLYRLRFLIFSNRLSLNGKPLLIAGNRLVDKYPDDLYVLMHHGYNTAVLSQSAKDSDKATRIANRLLTKSFRPHACYAIIAMAQWSRIIPEKSSERAKMAINNWKLSYKLSISDSGRQGCLQAIENIKLACKGQGIKYE